MAVLSLKSVQPPLHLPVSNCYITSVHLTHKSLPSVGATKLSEGVVKGAEATNRAIQKGGAKIRDRITPEETPSEVSPHVTRGLNVAKQATGGALRVSQFLGKNLKSRKRTKV